MKRLLFAMALALCLSPTTAKSEELTMCVRPTGSTYLIGPQYKRKECRIVRGDVTVTFNTIGPRGEPGNVLHLWDASGRDLGVLLNISGPRYTTYLPDADVGLSFAENRDQQTVTRVADSDTVYFGKPNCQGVAYTLGQILGERQTTSAMSDGRVFRGSAGAGVVTSLESRISEDLPCENILSRDWSGVKSYAVEPLYGLPESFAYPLNVASQ